MKWLSNVSSGPPMVAVWLPTTTLDEPAIAVIVNEAIVPMTIGLANAAVFVGSAPPTTSGAGGSTPLELEDKVEVCGGFGGVDEEVEDKDEVVILGVEMVISGFTIIVGVAMCV